MTTIIKGDSNINLDFSTGGRITGDFSNSTIANRAIFQSSTTNGASGVISIPNGTGVVASWSAQNSSDANNAANIALRASDTDMSVRSGILGTGTYLPMTFYTGGSERMRVDTSGNVLIGTSTTRTNYSGGAFTPAFQIEKAGDIRASITRDSDDASGPVLYLGKTRGTTVNSNTVVASGNNLGLVSFDGSDGTNLVRGAAIIAQVDGTPGSADMPGRLVFSTTADGAATATERMRIDSSGNVGIGAQSNGIRLYVQRAAGAYYQGEAYFTEGTSWMMPNSRISSGSYNPLFQNDDSAIVYSNGTQNNGAFAIGQWSTSQRGIRIDGTGNFQFNSGYGSVATAYGCRAWVNFNGTGTVAIRGSGNVSSITDNGTGLYVVNFSTALPDANYAAAVNFSPNFGASGSAGASIAAGAGLLEVAPTTTAFSFDTLTLTAAGSYHDPKYVNVTVFR